MTNNAMNNGRRRSLWVPLLTLVTLAACATAGYSYWRMQESPSAAAVAFEPLAPAPVFFALDTFTVNLGDADRVLYIGITLRLRDEATRQRINEYLPEVRSRLLRLFSRQNADALASDEGKQTLVEAIKSVLEAPLVPGQQNQVVSDVLYTAFILR